MMIQSNIAHVRQNGYQKKKRHGKHWLKLGEVSILVCGLSECYIAKHL